MAIFYNIPEMPVPAWASVTSDGRVFHRYYEGGKRRKVVLGKLVDKVSTNGALMMAPNENMRRLYSDEFEQCYGAGSSASNRVITGLYAANLRVCAAIGLYQCVQRSFGTADGNILMDLAMMAFAKRSSAVYLIDDFVEAHMHYSLNKVSSSSVSKMLTKRISSSQIQDFKVSWINEYQRNNDLKEVWLSIDGSNSDCKTVGSALAAHDKSKTGNSTMIIGQIWAVDVSTGVPVTWFVNEGNVPDCVAFERIMTFLGEHDLGVKGVLLDRGFASEAIMSLISSYGLEYIIMLKDDCNGFSEMFKHHCDDIRRVVSRRIMNGGLYGITGEVKVFRKSNSMTKVGLFFSSLNADERAEDFSDKLTCEIERIDEELRQGRHDIAVNNRFSDIISIEVSDDGLPAGVAVDFDTWQSVYDSKGYFAVASSMDIDARHLYSMYSLIDTSEKTFRMIKSELEFDTLRGHTDAGIEARIAVSFISAVFRQVYSNHCNNIGAKPNHLIDRLCNVAVEANLDGIFRVSNSGDVSVSKLFSSIGVTKADLADLATQMTKIRQGTNLSQYRELTSFEQDNIRTEADRFVDIIQNSINKDYCYPYGSSGAAPAVKTRKPGRPPGSKNKKTLAREATMSGDPSAQTQRRGRGRPPGSKNKSTLAREAAMANAPSEQVQRRGRGRPPGSRNKSTLAREAAMAEALSEQDIKSGSEVNISSYKNAFVSSVSTDLSTFKRGRGRPKGSKNKKTIEREMAAAAQALPRGRGRPPGSKNKKTLVREGVAVIDCGSQSLKRGRGRPPGSKNKKTLAREAIASAARSQQAAITGSCIILQILTNML